MAMTFTQGQIVTGASVHSYWTRRLFCFVFLCRFVLFSYANFMCLEKAVENDTTANDDIHNKNDD